MREIGLDLDDTSECLTINRKTKDKEICCYRFFFGVISIEFYPIWTY